MLNAYRNLYFALPVLVGLMVSSPPPSLAQSATVTFAEICSEPLKTTYGIKSCHGFDDEADVYYNTDNGGTPCAADSFLQNHVNGPSNGIAQDSQTFGNVIAVDDNNGTCSYPKLDTSLKFSGAASIRIRTASGAGSGAGGDYLGHFQRIGTPGSFTFGWYGPGSDFWVSWAEYDNTASVTNKYTTPGTTGGTKRMIIHGAAASAGVTAVVQDTDQIELIQLYAGPNKIPISQQQSNIGCGPIASLNPNDFPKPPCRVWPTNQWVIYHVHFIIPNPLNSSNGVMEIFMNDENMPIVSGTTDLSKLNQAPVLSSGWSTGNTWDVFADPEGGFGKFSITNFHTNKLSGEAHPDAIIWYDNMIISDTRIPPLASSATGGDVTPPSPPTGLHLN